MAKLIITNGNGITNLLIELNDGSQIEVDVKYVEVIRALQKQEQTIIEALQNQPLQSEV